MNDPYRMGEEVFKDIYESSFKLSNYGIPLWNPEPSSANPVCIGDVGYIYRGQFIKSANIEDSDAENRPPITPRKDVLPEDTEYILSPNIRFSTKAPTDENEVHQRQEQQGEPTAGIQMSQGYAIPQCCGSCFRRHFAARSTRLRWTGVSPTVLYSFFFVRTKTNRC